MSYHGQKLINIIKDKVSSVNLELIYSEFQYIEESNKIEISSDIICQLISIVGNYLVAAESQKIPEEFAIFDTFCFSDFMSEFFKVFPEGACQQLKYSSNSKNIKVNPDNGYCFFEKKGQITQNIKLNIYCFDPSLSFNDFIINEKPFSVFLISNYFGPYEILEYEFKTRFDVKSKNNCIYPTDNYQINIIESTLFQEEKIDFILDEINSDNIKMKIALGYTLLSLCYCNPLGNTLVFFPSMTFLYQCNMLWNRSINNNN